ncbi:MAG: L-threonine 3-dehydrogenase [Defluviitaleaceae bacterium]|nr:L-threonine 3-dehydrogenase [Defluviitaleaceae bacterium]MCL2239220.1 L-threonine 3-dehydrogenase [Defluviitaleaceae bacterium]
MKAIVKARAVPGALELREVPSPTPAAHEVLIQVTKTAICGTDIHIYKWDEWAQKTIKTPQIIGHEFVGKVLEVGAGVTHIKPGQLVSGEGHIVCGGCRHCITGSLHLCRQTIGVGVNCDGVFSEYITLPASNTWICDEKISPYILSMLDPLGNATHTALAFNILGEDVLVTGAGPIGLMSIPILKRAGARNIVVTDINPARLDMAKQLGATATINVRQQSLESYLSTHSSTLNIKEGFDIGLEMSGNAAAFLDMVNAMANGGKIALLGIIPSDAPIDWNKVVFNSLTIKGIYGRQMYDTWYRMAALLQSGLDKEIEPIITHRFHYEQFDEAFACASSGESGKIILEWS